MELDDFKTTWIEQNRLLNASLRLNATLLVRSNLGKAEGALGRHVRGLWFEAFVNFVAIGLLGSFAASVADEPRFLIPAIVLDVVAIAIFASLVRAIVDARGIDFDEPVVALQTKLALLRLRRLRVATWILATATLLWVPLLIVGLRGLFAVDAYAALGWPYLAANALFGVAMLALILWTARTFAPRWERHSFARRVLDDFAGPGVARARNELDTLRRFEDEEAA